jgi:hypothetical protein
VKKISKRKMIGLDPSIYEKIKVYCATNNLKISRWCGKILEGAIK